MSQATIIMVVGLFLLAILSGMLGLGVAFVAVPFLSLFLPDLVNQVQPLTLLLNGVTALFAVFGFARSRLVDWPKAIALVTVTTLSAPIGSLVVHRVEQRLVWVIYLASVIFLTYRLFKPAKARTDAAGQPLAPNFRLALLLAIPISILAGFLGVGPGFLLMPTLILVGFDPKLAAGMNAFAVTLPSFSAFIPHLPTAVFDPTLTIALLIAGAGGAFLGARITSLYVASNRLRQIFGVLIVVMTAYKLITLLT